MLNKKIRVAVVGAGELATNSRIPAYLSNPDVEFVGVVDTDAKKTKRAQKKFGLKKVFATMDELFEKEKVDAISICTPPHTHAGLSSKALRLGLHVLCEKPMADDLNKAKEILEIARSQNKLLMISSYRRFVPSFQRARKRIMNGDFGHVYCIEDIQFSTSPLLTWAKAPWYYDPSGGGVLFDLGPHCFDLLNFLYRDFPIAVSAKGFAYTDSPVPEFVACTLEYLGGRVGIGLFSWLAAAMVESTRINGTVGSMEITPKFSYEINRVDITEISLLREVTRYLIGLKLPNFPLLPTEVVPDPLQLETNCFVEQVKLENTSPQNALNGLNVLATIEAAKESLEQNKQVKIDRVSEI